MKEVIALLGLLATVYFIRHDLRENCEVKPAKHDLTVQDFADWYIKMKGNQ